MTKVKGFKFGKKADTVTIQFAEGHALHGIEVVVEKGIPIGVVLGASSGNISRAVEPLIKRIVSWNVEDDAGPVPVSREAFDECFDIENATALIGAWIEAVTTPLAE